jgi:hypothetical protein
MSPSGTKHAGSQRWLPQIVPEPVFQAHIDDPGCRIDHCVR